MSKYGRSYRPMLRVEGGRSNVMDMNHTTHDYTVGYHPEGRYRAQDDWSARYRSDTDYSRDYLRDYPKDYPQAYSRDDSRDYRRDAELEERYRVAMDVFDEYSDDDVNPRASICLAKGLLNPVGSNNCFLNCAIQVLWQLNVFRKNFRQLSGHACMQKSCIFCALKVIFTQFEFSNRMVLPPDALRHALASNCADQGRFQLGLMDDAAECFEIILSRLHTHLAHGISEDACQEPHCLTHQKFSMSIIEQFVCECDDTSDPLCYAQLVHYISTTTLIRLASSGSEYSPSRDQRLSFGKILCNARDDGEEKNCPSNCGKKVQARRTLANTPEVISVGLIWDSGKPSSSHIKEVIRTISTTIRPADMFYSTVDKSWAESTLFDLVGVVCYYGKHYSTFFLHPKRRLWLQYDDAKVHELGYDWDMVVDKCCRSLFQPLLLLYSSRVSEPLDVSTAPAKNFNIPSPQSSVTKTLPPELPSSQERKSNGTNEYLSNSYKPNEISDSLLSNYTSNELMNSYGNSGVKHSSSSSSGFASQPAQNTAETSNRNHNTESYSNKYPANGSTRNRYTTDELDGKSYNRYQSSDSISSSSSISRKDESASRENGSRKPSLCDVNHNVANNNTYSSGELSRTIEASKLPDKLSSSESLRSYSSSSDAPGGSRQDSQLAPGDFKENSQRAPSSFKENSQRALDGPRETNQQKILDEQGDVRSSSGFINTLEGVSTSQMQFYDSTSSSDGKGKDFNKGKRGFMQHSTPAAPMVDTNNYSTLPYSSVMSSKDSISASNNDKYNKRSEVVVPRVINHKNDPLLDTGLASRPAQYNSDTYNANNYAEPSSYTNPGDGLSGILSFTSASSNDTTVMPKVNISSLQSKTINSSDENGYNGSTRSKYYVKDYAAESDKNNKSSSSRNSSERQIPIQVVSSISSSSSRLNKLSNTDETVGTKTNEISSRNQQSIIVSNSNTHQDLYRSSSERNPKERLEVLILEGERILRVVNDKYNDRCYNAALDLICTGRNKVDEAMLYCHPGERLPAAVMNLKDGFDEFQRLINEALHVRPDKRSDDLDSKSATLRSHITVRESRDRRHDGTPVYATYQRRRSNQVDNMMPSNASTRTGQDLTRSSSFDFNNHGQPLSTFNTVKPSENFEYSIQPNRVDSSNSRVDKYSSANDLLKDDWVSRLHVSDLASDQQYNKHVPSDSEYRYNQNSVRNIPINYTETNVRRPSKSEIKELLSEPQPDKISQRGNVTVERYDTYGYKSTENSRVPKQRDSSVPRRSVYDNYNGEQISSSKPYLTVRDNNFREDQGYQGKSVSNLDTEYGSRQRNFTSGSRPAPPMYSEAINRYTYR